MQQTRIKKYFLTVAFALSALFAFNACGLSNSSEIVLKDDVQVKGNTEHQSGIEYAVDDEPSYIQEARAINPDVVGWITIPNTDINYPIVLGQDNEYYLTHNLEGEQSKTGAIFMDIENANPAYQQNIMLYGHNMKNKSMFNNLTFFKQKDFFDNAEPITVWLWGEERTYEVFVQALPDTSINFRKWEFDDGEDFMFYVEEMKNLARFSKDVSINKDSQILTLITCTYEYDDLRSVVQAVRTK